MSSDRGKRRIERLLDEADEAVSQLAWELVRDRASAVLAFEPDNSDANDLLNAAARALNSTGVTAPQAKPFKKPARARPLKIWIWSI